MSATLEEGARIAEAELVDVLLCQEVELRLATLRGRICAAGKAKLPHSRAVMGPPFVPALDFLRDAVRSLAVAAAAEAAAAAAAAATKRRRLAAL